MPVLISKTFVDTVTKPGLYADKNLTGFRLKVTDKLSKIYLMYGKVKRPRTLGATPTEPNKPVKVTIGKHGDHCLPDGTELTADRARKEAERLRGLMQNGINPNAVKSEAQKERQQAEEQHRLMEQLTVSSVLDEYISFRERTRKSASMKFYRYTVNSTMKDWSDRQLSEITEQDVADRYREIAETGHVGKANNFKRTLSVIFQRALKAPAYKDRQGNRLIKVNPVRYLSQEDMMEQLKPRSRKLKDNQLPKWFAAVNKMENANVRDYLLLLVLTGLRKDEAGGLKWDNVDFKEGSFTVCATKNGTDHTLPITPSIRAILKRRWALKENDYVFPGRSDAGYLKDMSKHQQRLIAETGIEFDLHDLRRTFASVAASLQLPPYAVKTLLNHRTKADITQHHYLEFEIDFLRKTLQLVDAQILKLAKTEIAEPTKDQVINISKRARTLPKRRDK